MNRISNTDWNIYFKRSLKGLNSRTTGSKLEVLILIRLEFVQEQTGSFDFFSLRSGIIRQLTSIKCSSLSSLMH